MYYDRIISLMQANRDECHLTHTRTLLAMATKQDDPNKLSTHSSSTNLLTQGKLVIFHITLQIPTKPRTLSLPYLTLPRHTVSVAAKQADAAQDNTKSPLASLPMPLSTFRSLPAGNCLIALKGNHVSSGLPCHRGPGSSAARQGVFIKG